jgi:glucosylceramidase
VAFKVPGGKTVLIVVNNGKSPKPFRVQYHGKSFQSSLKGGAVGTFVL